MASGSGDFPLVPEASQVPVTLRTDQCSAGLWQLTSGSGARRDSGSRRLARSSRRRPGRRWSLGCPQPGTFFHFLLSRVDSSEEAQQPKATFISPHLDSQQLFFRRNETFGGSLSSALLNGT